MKKIYILIALAFFMMNCEEDSLHELNVNPKQAETLNADPLFTYGQFGIAKQLADASYNNNVDRYWANYLTGTTYILETNYDAVNRDIGGNMFDNIYTESLLELKKAKEIVEAEEVTDALLPVKNNKLACITIMEVYAYQYLVDNFGYVPYTEALDIENLQPAYDSDVSVYSAITAELEDALNSIDETEGAFDPSADILFGADMSAWSKFGYSILLRIGIRQSEADPTEADRLVDLAVGNVMQGNSDNALYPFGNSDPYWNPVYDYFVINSRNTDFVATQFFIDILEDRNDPRIAMYLDQNRGTGVYEGGVYGANGQTYSSLTHVNPDITDEATFPGTLMEYSEVCFMLAEAVERGFLTTGTAAGYYEDGIRASFEAWGLTSTDADTYLAQANVAYATAAGTFEEKLGMQKWIAAFNHPNEAWTEARRLNFPALLPGAATGTPNPNRMIYPVEEKLINPNYADAASAMGGDELDSRVFWDVD